MKRGKQRVLLITGMAICPLVFGGIYQVAFSNSAPAMGAAMVVCCAIGMIALFVSAVYDIEI